MTDDFLDENTRAEDILLGSLGIDGDAVVLSVEETVCGYRGLARWPDGEEIEFESDSEPDELECWALGILGKRRKIAENE